MSEEDGIAYNASLFVETASTIVKPKSVLIANLADDFKWAYLSVLYVDESKNGDLLPETPKLITVFVP